MINQQLLQEAFCDLRNSFPKALGHFNSLPVCDLNDESGVTKILDDLIDMCKSEKLTSAFAQQVNELYSLENWPNPGVGMVNANLGLRCRALIKALKFVT